MPRVATTEIKPKSNLVHGLVCRIPCCTALLCSSTSEAEESVGSLSEDPQFDQNSKESSRPGGAPFL